MSSKEENPAGAAPSDRRRGAGPGSLASSSYDGLSGGLIPRSPDGRTSGDLSSLLKELLNIRSRMLSLGTRLPKSGERPSDYEAEYVYELSDFTEGSVTQEKFGQMIYEFEFDYRIVRTRLKEARKLGKRLTDWEEVFRVEMEQRRVKYDKLEVEHQELDNKYKDLCARYEELEKRLEEDRSGGAGDRHEDEGMEMERNELDRTIEPERIGTNRDGDAMGRMDKMEEEIARMANAVALLAETITLQGERLTGEMTSIRECAHAQWRMGGGVPLTSEEEDASAPRPSLPSVVCGAPKGGRPAGGGGKGARKRKQGEGKTGVSPPTQYRRVGSPARAFSPVPAATTPDVGGPVRPSSAAVHPPVSRGHPAAGGPNRPSNLTPAPRASAVVVRGRAEGFSYAEALRKAQREIPLGDLGIPEVRARRTAGGDLLVEVRDPPSGGVDALVGRLSSLLPEASVKRVEASGEVRLVGFDESVLPDDLVKALAEAGGCAPSAIRVGVPRINRGTGSAWARLPLEAANIAARVGRLRVGWSVVRVSLLGRRPLQCFGCWGYGHVLASCPSTNVDRTRTCFRCGVAGHKAGDCTARPFCAVCDGAGLYARHRMGGPSCELARRAAEGRGGRSGRRRGRPPNIGDRGRKGSGASGPPPP